MSLFSRIRRRLRRALDRAAGSFYEGPDPPCRYAEQARLFRIVSPTAGAIEWEAFASELARAAYRDGYLRGFEHELRTRDVPLLPLEHPADAAAREASLREHVELARLMDGDGELDPLRGLPLEERTAAAARLGAMLGEWRVVVVRPDGERP